MANPIATVTPRAVNVATNAAVTADVFIGGVTGAVTQYAFFDSGRGGGHFELNGVALAAGRWIMVTPATLAALKYVGGALGGAETVYVSAFNGAAWSAPVGATATTSTALVNHAPVVTAANAGVAANASIAASALIASVTDADKNVITQYAFMDNGTGGGHFVLNGVTQAAGIWITVSAADLARLSYVGGTAAGSETISIKAFDGKDWSAAAIATATTSVPVNHAPVVTAASAGVIANQSLAAGALIASVTDADKDAITQYAFFDNGAGGGHFVLNGVVLGAGSWITINAADLAKLTYVGGTAAGAETICFKAFDGKAWSAVASATVTTYADPFWQLADAGIHNDVVKLVKGGALDYAGMLMVLQDAAGGGITAAEFATLQTLDQMLNKAAGIAVSDYIFDVSNRLIMGDAANATWTGGGATSVALGNLKAGTTQTQMNELIGKWFLGTDLPTASDPYKLDTDPLYGASGGPHYLDVNQGALGDCYLLASIAEVALRDPNVIKSMFTDNGNGTYGVRFLMNGKTEYVTVDNELPYDAYAWANGSRLDYANGSVTWAALIEKAYVTLNMDGTPNNAAGNAYSLIEGGWADPITEITGKAVKSYYSTSYATEAGWETTKASLIAAVNAGEEALVATGLTTQGNLVGNHMFEVTGYDAATGNFMLHNPWGSGYGGSALKMTFEASMAELYSDKATFITALGGATV